MAQTSYFWDGTILGDATLAPYDDGEVTAIFEKLAGNFVVPGYLFSGQVAGDELRVRADPANFGQVIVGPGAAVVGGALYVSDADVTLAVPGTAGANPAIYRVVLDKDVAAQTVRAELRQGAEAAAPRPPVVANNEITLAWLYITGAYNAAADLFPEALVHDERTFHYIGPDALKHTFENVLSNPEFMASGAANTAPNNWILVNTPATSFGTSGGRSVRGKWVRLQGGAAGEGIETTVPINRGATADGEIWTIRGYIEVDVQSITIEVYLDILDGGTVLADTRTFWVMASPSGASAGITEFIMRVRVDPLSTTQNALRIRILSDNAATDGYIADMAVIPGYVAGTKETVRKSELIWLDTPYTDAAWAATAKSSGSTTISLSASFGPYVPKGVRGLVLRIRCRDSGSAAAAVADGASVKVISYRGAAFLTYTGIVSCTGKPNDDWESGVVMVAIDPNDGNGQFVVNVVATGAGTLDVTIEIIGIIT